MKYYTGLVNKTLADGTHHFTRVSFLVKRHRANADASWTYTVKIGYSESLDDVRNKPHSFLFAGDWRDAIRFIFDRELGWMEGIKLDDLAEVTL